MYMNAKHDMIQKCRKAIEEAKTKVFPKEDKNHITYHTSCCERSREVEEEDDRWVPHDIGRVH